MSKINGFCDANATETLDNETLLSIAMSDASAGLGPKVKRVNGKLVVPTATAKRRFEARNAAKLG